jgi:hypothetical protein
LVLLQVNSRSIYNETLDFWNVMDKYKPDVVIGTESWFVRSLAMRKFLVLITQLSEETGTLAFAEC